MLYLKKGKKCMGNEITIEEKKRKVQDFRPIDDAFFEVLADDANFCQEMLRIILDDDELAVEDVIVQNSARNIYGRSVRLDALCTFANGKKCNVEVQRSDDDDHLRRVRFNASSIAVKDSQAGQKFPELTKRMNYLKHQEGGLQAVCEVMERYERKAAREADIRAIKNMLKHGLTKENILEDYTEEEYAIAIKELAEIIK